MISKSTKRTNNKTRQAYRPWTDGQLRTLHRAAGRKVSVASLAVSLNRTQGAVRQQARSQGLAIGIRAKGVSTSRLRAGAAKRLGLNALSMQNPTA